MNTVLISVHVITMVLSLFTMPTAILLALCGFRASMKLASMAISLAGVGFFSGVLLLLKAPILNECLVLTAYLVLMVAIYAIGFGWGVEAKARLLRTA